MIYFNFLFDSKCLCSLFVIFLKTKTGFTYFLKNYSFLMQLIWQKMQFKMGQKLDLLQNINAMLLKSSLPTVIKHFSRPFSWSTIHSTSIFHHLLASSVAGWTGVQLLAILKYFNGRIDLPYLLRKYKTMQYWCLQPNN